jgi:hypothetical protein
VVSFHKWSEENNCGSYDPEFDLRTPVESINLSLFTVN